jgi:hypothetical protein
MSIKHFINSNQEILTFVEFENNIKVIVNLRMISKSLISFLLRKLEDKFGII